MLPGHLLQLWHTGRPRVHEQERTAASSAWLWLWLWLYGSSLRSAHVPAICIAVCLNCVNRPKLRISFGFNLELAACLLSRCCLSPSLSLLLLHKLRYPFVSQYVYLNAGVESTGVKSTGVEEVVSFSVPGNFIAIYALSHSHSRLSSLIPLSSRLRPICDICDVAVTNWLHWLPPVVEILAQFSKPLPRRMQHN